MLLASAVDITIGWVWHTAYRARWHWKLKREGALIAAGVVALVGAIDTARSLHGGPHTASPDIAALTAPVVATATPAAAPVVATVTAPARGAQGATPKPAAGGVLGAQAPDAPQFPIIQDQTGSIDQADPVETILPMDPSAQKDDPIARKINERFGDATAQDPAPKKKAKPVKTAAAKQPAPKSKPSKKKADDTSMD
jgi:hypothetical protein